MSNSSGQSSCTPTDLRNIVTEVLQSDEFVNHLKCSIQRASSDISSNNNFSVQQMRQQTMSTTPACELRRLFPSIRGNNESVMGRFPMRSSLGHVERIRTRKGSHALVSFDFKKDIILVTSPDIRRTLTGHEKSLAYVKSYAISAATFKSTWSEKDIFEYIENLFEEKLHGIKFEILIPISRNLVKPNLPSGTVFDGTVMRKIFTQKVIYVRPFSKIEETCLNTCNIDIESIENDEVYTGNNLPINRYVLPSPVPSDKSNLPEVRENNLPELSGDSVLELRENSVPELRENNLPELSGDSVPELRENNVPEMRENKLFELSENNLFELSENNLLELSQNNLIELEFLDDDTKIAIERSLDEKKNGETLLGVLWELHNSINTEKISYFNIYREDIFNCCVRSLRRRNFSPLNKISVLFTDIDNAVSEGAIDAGGPTREMFTLLLKYLANSMLFEGTKESKNITLCHEHLNCKHYYEAGRIVSLSLIHGGPSPQFFSRTLFNYLSNGVEDTKPYIEEVMNLEIRKELENIRDARNLPELQHIIMNSTFLAIAGFTNINSFQKKDEILEGAIKYYVIYRTMPALKQFKEGLNIIGLLEKLKVFKEELQHLMCYTESKLTAAQVSSTFTVKFSEIGKRESEASLEDVFSFSLACDKIPPLGFDSKPQLEFLHNKKEFLWPKANTCSLVLFLPVSYYAILNKKQFGFA
ncbi:hypothetical protein ABEB36_014496 [Hypothenemus hampei]|uniref:HECT domain-containing protein n=1 Tax=Hypothenemus hampei TaxID=57062 RepID=A0ABD1E1Z6_HYPHA